MLPRFLALAVLALLLVPGTGCSSPLENRDPTGTTFPAAQGTSLDGEDVQLPQVFRGQVTVLLVGYVQNAQFDCDRWILGLMQAQTPAAIYEIPTIEGLIPGMIAGTIDQGMRNGIPAEDWGSVITVYADAEAITTLTGNTNPANARVFVLDPEGTIEWFHDRGYSAGQLLELDGKVRDLQALPAS